MGRSLFRPSPANTLEDYSQEQRVLPCPVGHALLDDAPRRRVTTSAAGKSVSAARKPTSRNRRIDYVLGSGNHARSYLHRTARGTLIELPLGWYSEKGGYWAMSPGFDSRHPITRRLVSYECIFCHDGYPRIPAGHEAPGSEPVFDGDLPEGIDCQRCHGPGANHVRHGANRGRQSREQIRAGIVNPPGSVRSCGWISACNVTWSRPAPRFHP